MNSWLVKLLVYYYYFLILHVIIIVDTVTHKSMWLLWWYSPYPLSIFWQWERDQQGRDVWGPEKAQIRKNGNIDKSKWGGGISQFATFVVFFAHSMNFLHFVWAKGPKLRNIGCSISCYKCCGSGPKASAKGSMKQK